MRLGTRITWASILAFAVGGFAAAGAAPPAPAPPASEPSAAAGAAPGPAPRLRFDATTIDLGDVVRGNDAVAEFAYTNAGDGPLKILSAKPG